jgi:hypothetical protein
MIHEKISYDALINRHPNTLPTGGQPAANRYQSGLPTAYQPNIFLCQLPPNYPTNRRQLPYQPLPTAVLPTPQTPQQLEAGASDPALSYGCENPLTINLHRKATSKQKERKKQALGGPAQKPPLGKNS